MASRSRAPARLTSSVVAGAGGLELVGDALAEAEHAIEAEPVMGFPARSESDYYRLTLRLMQI